VRRIAHIEIALAERGSNGEAVATVVGEESASAKAPAKVKAKGKVPARKKKTRGAHK